MQWFPVGRDDSEGWRLDVVSLITILGGRIVDGSPYPTFDGF